MINKMISCENLVFKYTSTEEEVIEKLAVNNVTLEVKKGEFLVIIRS